MYSELEPYRAGAINVKLKFNPNSTAIKLNVADLSK